MSAAPVSVDCVWAYLPVHAAFWSTSPRSTAGVLGGSIAPPTPTQYASLPVRHSVPKAVPRPHTGSASTSRAFRRSPKRDAN